MKRRFWLAIVFWGFGLRASEPILQIQKGFSCEAPEFLRSILIFHDMGYVWLTGEVATEEQKILAERIARRALGRRYVLKNYIQVKGRGRASPFRGAVHETKEKWVDSQLSMRLFMRLLKHYGTDARLFRFQVRNQNLEIWIPPQHLADWSRNEIRLLGDLRFRRVIHADYLMRSREGT